MNNTSKIALTAAAPEIRKAVPESTPSYRVLYGKVLDGSIAAHQVNGRWFLNRDDIPKIAKMFCAKRVA